MEWISDWVAGNGWKNDFKSLDFFEWTTIRNMGKLLQLSELQFLFICIRKIRSITYTALL